MRRRWSVGVAVVAIAACAARGDAQTRPPAPCSAPEHRQFDFWLGEWDVRTPDGKPAGRNRIEKAEGECGLQENWTSAAGGTGRSLNAYSAADRAWHQAWLGSGGLFLHLTGGLRDGAMVMEGETQTPGKPSISQRITWTPQPGGGVRQRWEQSSDGGKSWKTVFDGIYTRRPPNL